MFPRLPLYYWLKENLGRIASYVGKPICADRMTAEIERVSFARALIGKNITQELPQEVYIERFDGAVISQAIKYEGSHNYVILV